MMPTKAIPGKIRAGWSWRVSSVSGNGVEVLVAGEDRCAIVAVGASEREWEDRLTEAGLWGGGWGRLWDTGKAPGLNEAAWLRELTFDAPVVITDDYLRPWVAGALEKAGEAWLVKLRGDEVWIGPKCRVGDGNYEELAYWLRSRRAERAAVAGWRYPPAVAVGWNGASLEMAKRAWKPGSEGALWCFDGRTGVATKHQLGNPALGGGGKLGVVTRVVHEGTGFGRHHALAEYCLPPLTDGWRRKRTKGFSYGSGGSLEEARRKAMYEAAERFSCFFDVSEDVGKPRAGEIFIGAQEDGENLSSVGCAAGESFADAVERATAEVVERYAVRRWWHAREQCPGIQRRLEGRDVFVLDLRCEFGWEVAVAVCAPEVAAGCARNWETAADKAMAELAQVMYWRQYWRDASATGYAALQSFQAPWNGELAPRTRRELPAMHVVNLTRKRVGVPVARVLIPELHLPAAGEVRCPL